MRTALAVGPSPFAAKPGTAHECLALSRLPKVFIVEPDPGIRSMLEHFIQQAGWEPVARATAEEFLEHPREITASCLLVEAELPGLSGLELQELVAQRKEMPVIFTSASEDIRTTVKAMKAGAFEFLTKPFREDALLDCVRLAIDASACRLGEALRMRELLQCYAELSRREREVLQLVTAGRLNKQVGFDLGISEITVKAHRGSLMRKMRASSLPELVGMVAELSCGTGYGQAVLRPLACHAY